MLALAAPCDTNARSSAFRAFRAMAASPGPAMDRGSEHAVQPSTDRYLDLIQGHTTDDRACDSAVKQIFFNAPNQLPMGPPRPNGPSVVDMVQKTDRLDPFWPGSPRFPRGLYDKGIYPESPEYDCYSDSDSESLFDNLDRDVEEPTLHEVSVSPSRKRPRLVLPADFDDHNRAKYSKY